MEILQGDSDKLAEVLDGELDHCHGRKDGKTLFKVMVVLLRIFYPSRNRQYGVTPLHAAIAGRNLDCVKLLVDKGASLDVRDYRKIMTGLITGFSSIEIKKFSFQQGFDVSAFRRAERVSHLRLHGPPSPPRTRTYSAAAATTAAEAAASEDL